MNRNVILTCSVILFVLACSMPALEFRRNEDGFEVWDGGEVLCLGWLGFFLGQFAWLANWPLLASAVLLFFRKRTPSVICAGVALLISLNTFTLFGIEIPGDEGGVNKLFLKSLREGTWLWFASILVMLIGGFIAKLAPRKEGDPVPVLPGAELLTTPWLRESEPG